MPPPRRFLQNSLPSELPPRKPSSSASLGLIARTNDWTPDVACRDSSTREVDKRTLRTVATTDLGVRKAQRSRIPETHYSADGSMKEPSFRKDTVSVFLRHDAEPEIQELRYRPVGEIERIATHLIVWDIFSSGECLDICQCLCCECIESLQEQLVRGRGLKAVH